MMASAYVGSDGPPDPPGESEADRLDAIRKLYVSYIELMLRVGPYGPQMPADQTQHHYQMEEMPGAVGYLLAALDAERRARVAWSKRVADALMLVNFYYMNHDYDHYWKLMEHLRMLRDDLDIAKIAPDTAQSDAGGGSE